MYINQTIANPHGISVLGSAMMRVVPDRAVVQFSSRCSSDLSLDAAVAAAQEVQANIQEALGNFNVTDVQVGRVNAGTFKRKNESIGFRASIRFRVVVSDLSITEALLGAVVKAGATRVDDTTFTSASLREFRQQARRMAVANAREKAELYAEAAGVSVGKVLHIEDVDPSSLERGGNGHVPAPTLDDDGTSPMGAINVGGAVQMSFAIGEG